MIYWILVAAFASGLFYWFLLREWFLNWGATPKEKAHVMEGDYLIDKPTDKATQVITIDTPPALIWPWLVQIGYRRGGLYSYDWLDRLFGFLDRPSANIILSEFQKIKVGDTISLGPKQKLKVEKILPNLALVLVSHEFNMDWVWQFGLYPIDDSHTRLVSRGIERIPRNAMGWVGMRFLEPAAFIMTLKMLRGLKRRAEGMKPKI